jgi:hypothetical protein
MAAVAAANKDVGGRRHGRVGQQLIAAPQPAVEPTASAPAPEQVKPAA